MAKRKFYGSLARRIILVGGVLVLIPLILFAMVLWDRDMRIQRDAKDLETALIEAADQKIYQNWISAQLEDLRGVLPEYASRFRLDADLKCLSSTLPKMVGRSDLFPPSLKGQQSAFLQMNNPVTGAKEVFVLAKVGEDYEGLSIPEERFRALFPKFQEVTNAAEMDSLRHLLVFLLVFLGIGVAGSVWLFYRISAPMRQLEGVMESAEAEDYTKRYVQDRFGFEINDLGARFNQTLEAMLKNLEAAKELTIGRELQKQLLPKELPQFPGIQVHGGFWPAKEVGGDTYSLLEVDSEHLMVMIGDGSDKGISACLYALIVGSMLRSFAKSGQDVSSMFKNANNLFLEDTKESGNFVTAWLGLYNASDRTLTYSSAGHNPAILMLPSGEMKELQTDGVALGATFIEDVDVKRIDFPKGALLFLYTDGLTEAHNEKGELFGKSRLMDSLRLHCVSEPREITSHLIEEVRRFSGGALQHDDLTALCIKSD